MMNLAEARFVAFARPERAGMHKRSTAQLRLLLCGFVLLRAVGGFACYAYGADSCPTTADEIATDRPDVTNSSLVVPSGSLQAENGIDWTVHHGSNALDATNTRLRFGIAQRTEFLIDVPSHFGRFRQASASGSVWF
jgi:hypothetical protein